MVAKTQFLELEKVKSAFPSVFAESHDGKRSDRYTFVPSTDIIANLDRLGFGLTNVRAPAVRKADPGHCKHELTFRPRDENMIFEDPRIKVINHHNFHLDRAKVFPELKIIHSSDGTCSFQAMMGIFALICANGLVVGYGQFGAISARHMNFDYDEAMNIVNQFTERTPLLMDTMRKWSEINLEQEQRLEFASNAAHLRWEKPTFDPATLLTPRRDADRARDLWTTFNTVQENLIQGGFRPNQPKARKVRTLTNIVQSNEVNQQLWDLAAKMAA